MAGDAQIPEEVQARPEPGSGGPGPFLLERLIAVLLVITAFVSASYKTQNPDLFWHLTVARHIVETGEIPRAEFASYTAAGREWTDYEWGYQLFVRGIWSLGGFAGLSAVNAALVALAILLLYRATREAGGDVFLSALLGSLAIVGGRARFDVRPEIFTFVFLPLLILLLGRFRRGQRAALWFLPPLFALWANLHPGFIFGIGVLGLAVLGELGNWLLAGRRAITMGKALAVVTALSIAATFLGPNLHRPWLLIFESVWLYKSTRLRNLEWTATPLPWDLPAAVTFLPFWILVAATFLFLAVNRRRADLVDVLHAGAFAFLGASSVRNAALFPFVAAPICACYLRIVQPTPLAEAPGGGRRFFLGTALVLQLLLLASMPSSRGTYVAGWGVDERAFPVAAADYVEKTALVGNLFNDYRFGGYLSWRFYPERRVFIDGKHIPYVPLLRELDIALRGWYSSFRPFLRKWGIEWAVLRYQTEGGRGRSALYFPREEWDLVFWDDTALVFVRRYGPNAAIAQRDAYRHVNPDDMAHELALVRSGEKDPAPMLDDLERKLREDPGCRRARVFRDALLDLPAAAPRPASSR